MQEPHDILDMGTRFWHAPLVDIDGYGRFRVRFLTHASQPVGSMKQGSLTQEDQ
jgi:hypothetical protein